jgi:hypothetical protein
VSDAPSSIYAKARADVASMLGYDLDNLSAEQALRLDVASALRVLLDNQSARLVKGESLDARELLMASEALSRLLPPLREPPPEANAPDPRETMLATYMAMRKRGEIADPMSTHEGRIATVEKLRAELASKDARIGELEAALAGSVPLPPNAVKLSPRSDNPAGRNVASKDLGDNSKAAPPTPTPPPAYDYNKEQGWKDYVEPTGEIRSTPRGRFDV